MFNRFVIPERLLFPTLLKYQVRNIVPIIDYAIEHDKNNKYIFEQKYKQIFHHYPNNYHAIKLTGLDLCSSVSKNLADVSLFTNNKLLIDAEDVRVQDRINTITNQLLQNNNHIFKTYQMYRKDALELLLNDIEYFTSKNKTLNIKLVRGAYLHNDKYTGALYDTKEETDKAYDYAIDIIKSHQQDLGEIIFATHNKKSYEKVKYMDNDKCFHASLMGFDDPLNWHGDIQKMVYVPFGPFHKTVPYLMRRLYENPYILRN
jgi:hypothetical protein